MFPRAATSVVLLPYGKVLVAGGIDNSGHATPRAEIFNPATNSFEAANWLTSPRMYGNAVLLRNGHVLITGGSNDVVQFLSSVERYSPQ
jgi:hypothetical protein